LLPGIYLAQTGTPMVPQQEMAALLHGGPGSVLTGQAALHGLGLVTAQPCCFDVLVPATRRPASLDFVSVHRTTRMPQRVIREGERRYALPPRAFADAARSLADLAEVRALIAGAVQRGVCPLSALARELGEGQMWDSARLRRVLEEVADGILVLHFTPRQIRTDPARVIATIRATPAVGAARPVLRLIARAAA
jgi:hypothetical protein